ncbi:MAG: PBP1A family penicillin-binding protein [Chloroflexi bacterium]|nr:PBP1A family penicillin-binding protein [Chloroflexota bacterium]
MRKTVRKKPGGSFVRLAIAALAFLFVGTFVAGILAVALLGGGLLVYFSNLPSPEAVVKRDVFQSTMIYDRNGELLYEIWDPQGGRRQVIPLSEIPGYLRAATLSTEDADFYTNPGFDAKAIVRALWQNLRGQEIVSGASTITQQLIRNTMLGPEERYKQSYDRKLKEILLAYRLSQQYTKDQILEWYLNEIYYGNLAYGVEAAAQAYFGKSAKDLDLAESAMLAGLPQMPAEYNPLINPKAAKERQAEVLDLMAYHTYITKEQAEAAKKEPLKFVAKQFDIKAPHFVMYVRELLEKKFGREKLYYGGLRVYTTLDYKMYLAAEKAAREHVASIRNLNASNAGVVTIDPKTGEILAMVGSVDYFDPKISGQVNMALAERQPGSSLKPFNYAASFAKGLHPATVVLDQPIEFPGGAGQPPYRPHNHDMRWHGAVTLRQALAQSLNIPAVLVLQYVGVNNFVNLLHEAGITSLNDPQRYSLALTLGSGEVKLLDLTFVYASLANKGVQIGAPVPSDERKPGQREYEPVAILKVVDSDGKVLEQYTPPEGKQIFSPQIAWMITDILSDDVARTPTYGPNSFLKLSRPAAAKTGTTDDFRDGWTVGYTPDLVTGVWIGNSDSSPMTNVFGVSGAGYIWHNVMEELLKDKPVVSFEQPPGLVKSTAYAVTLRPPFGFMPVTDWFLDGTVPQIKYEETGLPPVLYETGTQSASLSPVSALTPMTASIWISDTGGITSSMTISATSPFLLMLANPPALVAPTPTPLESPSPRYPTPQAPFPVTTPQPGSKTVIVPSVAGLDEAEARARIEAAGLNNTYPNYQGPGDVPTQVFESVAPGCVLSQTPQPGTKVQRGTTVYLAVRKRE